MRLIAGKAEGEAHEAYEGADGDVSLLPEPEYRANVRQVEKAIKSHHGLLLNWLAKRLGNSSDAADVAQDVYIRIYRYARTEWVENPQALLFKTAANLAINELKRQSRVLQRQVTTADDAVADVVSEIVADGPTPEEAMRQKQDIHALVDAIRRLPEKPRAAFIKNRFEGKTYGDIAVEMSVSESTVEKYMLDALRRLRGRLVRPSAGSVLPMPRRGRRGKG